MNSISCAGLLALSMAAIPALAEEPRSSAGIYAEVDNEDGFGIAGDLTLHATERTSWHAAASYVDSSSQLAAVDTRGFDTSIYHDFGAFGLEIGLGIWSSPDLLEARHAEASLDWHGEVWTLAVLTQLRRSDFAPFQASGTVTLRDGRQVTVSATADCSSDDMGVGFGLAFASGAWDGYLRGMSYDYDETRCQFSSPGLEALARTRREAFRQFAPLITERLSAYAAVRIGVENTLLKDSWSASVGYRPGRTGFSLDYAHYREFFGGLGSDALSGRVTFALTDSVDGSLTLGAMEGDAFDTIVFGGVGLRTKF